MARRKTKGVAEQATAHAAGTRTLEIRAVGNSLGAVVPRDVLAKLGASEGGELRVVGEIIERDREALAALSKR